MIEHKDHTAHLFENSESEYEAGHEYAEETPGDTQYPGSNSRPTMHGFQRENGMIFPAQLLWDNSQASLGDAGNDADAEYTGDSSNPTPTRLHATGRLSTYRSSRTMNRQTENMFGNTEDVESSSESNPETDTSPPTGTGELTRNSNQRVILSREGYPRNKEVGSLTPFPRTPLGSPSRRRAIRQQSSTSTSETLAIMHSGAPSSTPRSQILGFWGSGRTMVETDSSSDPAGSSLHLHSDDARELTPRLTNHPTSSGEAQENTMNLLSNTALAASNDEDAIGRVTVQRRRQQQQQQQQQTSSNYCSPVQDDGILLRIDLQDDVISPIQDTQTRSTTVGLIEGLDGEPSGRPGREERSAPRPPVPAKSRRSIWQVLSCFGNK